MNEIKMPAAFAEIDENEMVYLNGGSITDTEAILWVSSRFFTALPVLLAASMISAARRWAMVFSPRLRL